MATASAPSLKVITAEEEHRLNPVLPSAQPGYHRQHGVRGHDADSYAVGNTEGVVDGVNIEKRGFRLNRVSNIMADLRQEQFTCAKLYKMYARVVSTIDKVTVVSSSIAVATGAGGTALISKGAGVLAGAALEGVAIGAGIVSLVGRLANRRLNR